MYRSQVKLKLLADVCYDNPFWEKSNPIREKEERRETTKFFGFIGFIR
jgi:hypothetical protein